MKEEFVVVLSLSRQYKQQASALTRMASAHHIARTDDLTDEAIRWDEAAIEQECAD